MSSAGLAPRTRQAKKKDETCIQAGLDKVASQLKYPTNSTKR
jgi:hypothetical protein